MIHKKILNGLTLSLMLTLIPSQAQAGWFSWMGDYFNKPSKNALVATTAIAGVSLLATFACALNWWKTSKLAAAKEEALQTANNIAKLKLHGEKLTAEQRWVRSDIALQNTQRALTICDSQLAQARNQVDQLTDSLNQAWTQAQQNGKKVQEELAAKDAQLGNEQYKLHQRNVTLESDYIAQVKALKIENDSLKARLEKLKQYEKQSGE